MLPMDSVVAKRALFSGNVQGVGFRFTARAVAKAYGVTGYVRNLVDGRVEVVVEGESDKVGGFVRALQEEFAGYVRSTKVERLTPTGSYTGFGIEF